MPKTKQQKREEAAERQTHYDSLSVADRIKLVSARRGNNKRELARLHTTHAPVKPTTDAGGKKTVYGSPAKLMPDGSLAPKVHPVVKSINKSLSKRK